MPFGWRQTRPFALASAFAMILPYAGCASGAAKHVIATHQPWHWEGLSGRRITTEHFDIISTLRDAELEAALPDFVEALYKRYEQTIAPSESASGKLVMYIFGTRSEWARFSSRRYATRYAIYSKIRSGGFSEGDTSVSFHVNRSATLATLAHEGWHQYAESRCGASIPAWLNEGLACYHEAVRYDGAEPKFTPRYNTFRMNSLRDALRTGTLLSLTDLISTDAGEVIQHYDSRMAHIYYAQAWALVAFLRHGGGERYSAAFERLLDDLAAGTFNVRVAAARLGGSDASGVGDGEAAFRAYFGAAAGSLSDAYYDYLVRTVGY